MVVALGIGCDGRKTVLGLREGATENATVVGALLEDLAARGLDFTVPRLYVLDGSKALLPPIARRDRVPQHLANRLAGQPELPRRLPFTHPLNLNCSSDTRIEFHCMHTSGVT